MGMVGLRAKAAVPKGVARLGFARGHLACVVAGARVATDQGLIAVEALRAGDLVLTLGHGTQQLRWCGHRTVASQGAFAAVSIPAGTFGHHGALRVSPEHRLLMPGWLTDLEVEDDTAGIKAADLVHAGLLWQDHSGCPVTYFHLLFDRPVVINAEGLWTDSAKLGPSASSSPEITRATCAMSPVSRAKAR